MGGALSLSDDNDELVDNLVASGYLKTAKIEQAMRCVDRGDYFPKNLRRKAYRDIAWKDGFLHLSAPCIYAKVLECLDIQPGMMFLNLGSGTGYLSTVIGFLLGSSGYNYGIEINNQALEYSIQRLKIFLSRSIHLDAKDFCAPSFLIGNCFQMDIASSAQSFDRVYCGAAIPQEHVDNLKHFLKVGGLMVYPQDDQLFVLKRIALESFDKTSVLPVSFASMVPPDSSEMINLPPRQAKSLKDLCRIELRHIIRKTAYDLNPDFEVRCLISRQKSRKSPSVDTLSDFRGMQRCDGSDPIHCAEYVAKKRRCLYNRINTCAQDEEDAAQPDYPMGGQHRNQPYNCLEYRLHGGIGLCIFSARRRERQHFNNFINRVINPAVFASAVEKENLSANDRIIENDGRNQEIENIDANLLPSTSTSRAPHMENFIDFMNPKMNSSELSGEDDILKGCYLPDYVADDVMDESHDINGENESQIHDDSGFLSASNVNKRFRTKSGSSEDSDRKERRKIKCIDRANVVDKSVSTSSKEQVDVETMTNEEINEELHHHSPEIISTPPPNCEDADDADSTTSSGVDSDWEQIHREHTKKDRERSRARLRLFVDDFDRRLAALPLPMCLIDYLAYGRRLDVDGGCCHCVEN